MLLTRSQVYRVLQLWSLGHLTCENITQTHDSYIAHGKKGSIKKNLHISGAIKPAGDAKDNDVKFTAEKYEKTTNGLASKAAEVFNTKAAMEQYHNAVSFYRRSARSSKKSKTNKSAESKVPKISGVGAQFLNMPTSRPKQ
jgi:hypothetical protein